MVEYLNARLFEFNCALSIKHYELNLFLISHFSFLIPDF